MSGGGVAPEALFEGIEQGRTEVETEHGVRLRWCTDIDGGGGPELAVETVELVLRHRPAGLVSLGLGGTEVPRAQFARAFEIARGAGLHSVPHAGEAAGPESVWDAIDRLGAERIGHGVRCLEDPELVAELRRRRVPLEVCPTSNVRTGVVADLAAHPLPRLIEEGLIVTLNSDDPPMFGTSLRDEYITVARVLGLSPAGQSLTSSAARIPVPRGSEPDDEVGKACRDRSCDLSDLRSQEDAWATRRVSPGRGHRALRFRAATVPPHADAPNQLDGRGLVASGDNKGDSKSPRPPVNPARATRSWTGIVAGAATAAAGARRERPATTRSPQRSVA